MTYRLSSTEFAEHLESLRHPQPGQKKLSHPSLGDVTFCTHQVSHIQAMGLDVELPGQQLILSDTQPHTETINISFQLGGSMLSRFAGIDRPLDMTTGVHNLIYLSGDDNGDSHTMDGNQEVSVLQLTIEKEYYLQCLHRGDAWSESIISRVEKNIPFSASERSLAITPRMRQLISLMRNDVSSAPLKMLLFQSRLLELLSLQIDQFSSRDKEQTAAAASPDDRQKLYALKSYLDGSFLSDLTLTQLSRVVCLNEFKMKKGFRNEFGDTVFGYLKKLRMQHAGHLLRDTSCSVDEVAAALGYEHTHHFSKAFKDFTGCTPTAYRD